MARLGSRRNPAIVRVKTMERASAVLEIFDRLGKQAIVGVEPDQDEDLSDLERLTNPPRPVRAAAAHGRNDPCPCGSGRKVKRCCGPAADAALAVQAEVRTDHGS